MWSRVALAGALCLAQVSLTQSLGVPWNCAAQPGPFSIWVNEISQVGTVGAANQGVEVLSVASAAINYNNIDLIILDANAKPLKTIGLTTCDRNNIPNFIAWTCRNLVTAGPVGGVAMALVNTRGQQTVGSRVMISYVSTEPIVAYGGMEACIIPPEQAQHANNPGVSLQLVNTAQFDNSISMVDIYGFSWQGLLPDTFGAVNQGQSDWGEFIEAFNPALLQPPFNGDPATFDNNVDPGAGNCTYGDLTDWTACSIACQTPDAPNQAGTQIRYNPIVTFPASGDASVCLPLAERSEVQPCTPTAACTPCNDLRRTGVESDIDCGGGLNDTFPAGSTLQDVANALAQGDTGENTDDGTGPGCARCFDGRLCRVHADCDASAGLMCVDHVCTPYWYLNTTWFVDILIRIPGMDPNQLSGAAWDIFRMTVAEVAGGNGANVTAHDVSAVTVQYQPHTNATGGARLLDIAASGRARRVAESKAQVQMNADGTWGRRQMSASGRKLANPDDILAIWTRVAADSHEEAVIIGQNLRTNMNLLIGLLQDRLRLYAPGIGKPIVDQPQITYAPYDPNGRLGGSAQIDTGLSGGAIAGIVIAAVVGSAMIVGGLIGLSRYRHQDEQQRPARQRRAMDIGETKPSDSQPVKAEVETRHRKASFAPTTADALHELKEAPQAADGQADTAGSIQAASEKPAAASTAPTLSTASPQAATASKRKSPRQTSIASP